MEENPFAELESVTPKAKRWVVVIEKIIAGLLIAYGLLLIVSIISVLGMSYHKDYLPENSESSLRFYIINYVFQIVYSILTIYAGVLLMFKKRLGWIFALVIFSLAIVFILQVYFTNTFSSDASFIAVGLFILAIPCIPLYLLVRNEMIKRHQIKRRDFGIAGAIFILLLLLRFLSLIIN